MTFASICVGAVITVLILVLTFLYGLLVKWASGSKEELSLLPWVVSSIGFGVCLTILLYQNGIIS